MIPFVHSLNTLDYLVYTVGAMSARALVLMWRLPGDFTVCWYDTLSHIDQIKIIERWHIVQ